MGAGVSKRCRDHTRLFMPNTVGVGAPGWCCTRHAKHDGSGCLGGAGHVIPNAVDAGELCGHCEHVGRRVVRTRATSLGWADPTHVLASVQPGKELRAGWRASDWAWHRRLGLVSQPSLPEPWGDSAAAGVWDKWAHEGWASDWLVHANTRWDLATCSCRAG